MSYGYKWFLRLGELTDSSILGLMTGANELIHCDYSLLQGVDDKGQASTNVRTGGINCVYDGLPTQDIINWALDSRKYISGAIVLCNANNVPVKKVFFVNGALSGMRINYINDGDSSIITQLIIQPQFLESDLTTLDSHWTTTPAQNFSAAGGSVSSVIGALLKLAQPIGKTTLKFIMDGTKYEVQNFNMAFSQPSDFKGQPEEEVHGGIVSFSIPQLPDSNLESWAMSSDMRKNGRFEFKRESVNDPLDVVFEDAYCVAMRPTTNMGSGVVTQLVLSANYIELNGKSVFNKFKL